MECLKLDTIGVFLSTQSLKRHTHQKFRENLTCDILNRARRSLSEEWIKCIGTSRKSSFYGIILKWLNFRFGWFSHTHAIHARALILTLWLSLSVSRVHFLPLSIHEIWYVYLFVFSGHVHRISHLPHLSHLHSLTVTLSWTFFLFIYLITSTKFYDSKMNRTKVIHVMSQDLRNVLLHFLLSI